MQIRQFSSDVIVTDIPSIQLTTEWQRFEITGTSTTDGARIEILGGIQNISAWGAQLETGPYAGDYAKTEASAASSARNVAFLPDGSGNFVSAGALLLEDAGTNLVPYSEELDQATQTKLSVTPNAITAPDGKLTADKLVLTATGHAHAEVYSGTVSTSNAYGYINLNTGVSAKQNGSWNGSTVTDVGNGWWYITVTSDQNYTLSFYAKKGEAIYATWQLFNVARIGVSDTGNIINTIGSGGAYIWGAQLEQSAYATSYIPTYGSTATRAADVSSSSSNTFGNSFYNQTEGTLYGDSQRQSPVPAGGFSQVFYFNDGSNTNTINLGYLTSSAAQLRVRTSSINEANLLSSTSALRRTTAGAYALNNAAVSENGAAALTDSSVTIPSGLNQVSIGTDENVSTPLNGTISRLTYWPTRLSNDTLQTITV